MLPARVKRRLIPKGQFRVKDEFVWKRLWPIHNARAVVTTDFDQKMCVRCDNLGDLIAAFGRDEEKRIPELLASLPTGSVVLDIGAHIGRYSLMAAEAVGRSGRVFAFEPDKSNACLLKTNAQLNNLDQIKIVQAAAGNKTGTIDILVSDVDTMWTSTRPKWTDALHYGQAPLHTKMERVPLVAIDDFLREHNIGHVALMKIDVEAAELDVLAGAKASLSAGRIGQVIVEVHQPLVSPTEVSAILTSYNYKFEKIANSEEEFYAIHDV
jgi:FkbM family methyltransferase